MDRFKGLMLFLLLSLKTPVAQELHEYFSKTQAASLTLCLQHAQCLVARLACHCVFLQVLIYFLGRWTKQTCSSVLPLLPSSARRASLVLIGGSGGLQWGS